MYRIRFEIRHFRRPNQWDKYLREGPTDWNTITQIESPGWIIKPHD